MSGLSFPNDLWDSFETVCIRLKQASAFEREFSALFSSYAKETREFARKLLLLTKVKEEAEEFYSLKTGWLSSKQEIDKIANVFLKLADDITYKVSQPVENHLKETSKVKRKGKEVGRKLIVDLTESIKLLEVNKSEYEKAMRVLDQSKAENERAQNLNELYNSTKVKKKLETDKKKAESCEKRYRRAVSKTQQLEIKLFDTEMPKILGEFEQIERTRLSTIKSCLGAFSQSHEGMIPQFKDICESLNKEIDTIQPDADLDQFILDKRTGKNKQTSRTEYEEYNPQYKACVKEGATPVGSSPMNSRNSMLVSTEQQPPVPNRDLQSSNYQSSSGVLPVTYQSAAPVQAPLGGSSGNVHFPSMTQSNLPANPQTLSMSQMGSVMPGMVPVQPGIPQPAAQPAPPALKGIGTCRALHDYTASQPTELSFKSGDIITIIEKDKSGWWVGELNGRMGFFPSAEWVEEMRAPPPVNRASMPPTQSHLSGLPQQPMGQHSLGHSAPGVLPPGAMQSQHTMPGAHLMSQQPLAQPVQGLPPQVPARGRRCRAIFEMAALNQNELALREGDILFIESEADGWFFGTNARGERGMFPSSFVILE